VIEAGTLTGVLHQRASSRASQFAMSAILVVAGAALTALAAQVKVFLPFTPVPVTGQTFAVLLMGAGLGARRGMASQGLYVTAGLAGLPVFVGGTHGYQVLWGPRGGYLLGFVLAAGLAGRLAESGWDRRPHSAIGGLILANLVIYAAGLPWLWAFAGHALRSSATIPASFRGSAITATLYAGFVPFVVGDALKLLLAGSLLPGTWALIEKVQRADPTRGR